MEINNKITFEENGKYVTYEYDKYGKRKVIQETTKEKGLVRK